MPGEFELIQNIKERYGLKRIGDDCAVLPKDAETDLVMTADMLVEDVDFRLDWAAGEDIGHKALAVSLSDIAAMGAIPKWTMLSIGVPERLWKTDLVDRFYEGYMALAAEFGVELIGGDISKVPDKIVIDSVAGGEVPHGKAVLRSGASVGDSIFVTGTLGGSAGGLKLLESGLRPVQGISKTQEDLIRRQLRPQPRTAIGILLRERNIATSMIDISDGISSDIRHICDASGVGALIFAEQLPVDRGFVDISRKEALGFALDGGEDFELLFTVRSDMIESFTGISATQIGVVTDSGSIEIVVDGTPQPLRPNGFQHFK